MTDAHRHGSAECRKLFERLSEYVDGELPVDLCAAVDAHLGDCPPCRVFLESLRRTVRLVEGVEAPPLPDEVRRAVVDAYRRFEKAR